MNNDHRCHDCSPHMRSDGKGGTELAYVKLCSKHRGVEWQPIETALRENGPPILVALIADGKVWRVSDARYKRIGFYSVHGGDSCHWANHWMPLPAPPS